jgi:hypothetical protein
MLSAARHCALNKGASDVADTFDAATQDIWINFDCDRCEALRKAAAISHTVEGMGGWRTQNPYLFRALQAS